MWSVTGVCPVGHQSPGTGVFTPGLEVVGSCCCGLSCLLWIVCCLNPSMQTPRRCCFLLQEEIDDWGRGGWETHIRSRPWGGFTLVCAHSGAGGGGGSWAPQQRHGVAQGERGSCPGTPAGMVDGGVALPLTLPHGCLPQQLLGLLWGSGQHCLGMRGLCCIRSSVLPALPASGSPAAPPGAGAGGGCGTWPLVTPSLHRTPLLLGTFTNYISRFSHFEAALGASWLIATSPIMIGRRASDFQAMADLWLSELANEHGENELFRLT